MKLRMLALLRELRVRLRLRGDVGGSLESRDGCRFGLARYDGSPGTDSSVRPARELGARAWAWAGTMGRSLSMLGRPNLVRPTEVEANDRGENSSDRRGSSG